MGAKGDKQQSKSGDGIQQLCGLALVEEIVAINPTNEQKAKMYGYEYDETRDETEYVGKNDAGDEKLNLDIYFKIEGYDIPRKHRFFLENTPAIRVDEDQDKTYYKWVNQVGQTMFAESKEDLPQWFTEFNKWDTDKESYVFTGEKKSYRKCLKGEDQLMRFIREALAINYDRPSAELSYNYSRLFSGNVKELLSDLQGDLFRKFIVMLQVTTSQDGSEHYEKIWIPNNNFGLPTLSPDMYKHINNGCNFPKGRLKNKWEKYKNGELVGGYLFNYNNYPPSGFAPLGPVKPYVPEEDLANSTGKQKEKVKETSENDDEY